MYSEEYYIGLSIDEYFLKNKEKFAEKQRIVEINEIIKNEKKQKINYIKKIIRILKKRIIYKKYNSNYSKEYYVEHKDELKQYRKNYYQQNKQYFKNYSIQYRKNNKENIKIQRRNYYYIAKNNLNYRLKQSLRGRIRRAIKQSKKSNSTMNLVGCTLFELKQHLESKFQPGMNWDNYGKGGWEVDHIKPCASFDLSNPEQQKICFHYSNLQPLWGPDNWAKRDLLDWTA